MDELYPWLCSYSSLSLINTNILHPTSVIDAQYETRKLLTEAVATQFFGAYVRLDSGMRGEETRKLLTEAVATQFFGAYVRLDSGREGKGLGKL